MAWKLSILLPLTIILATEGLELRVMRIKMSNDEHSGMDSNFWGGGDFKMNICSGETCCETGKLNSDDDNWERGEQNFFVGRQLGGCDSFKLDPDQMVTLKVIHVGSDSGKIEDLLLRGSLRGSHFTCHLDVSLDDDETKTVECQYQNNAEENSCNGNPKFCDLRVNEFTFAGAHNSGTGQKDDPNFPCFYKNHDLHAKEQLDFGLRFLDLDATYETSGNCQGLETGHGPFEGGTFYQCFGKVRDFMKEVKDFMDSNTNEVVIVHFGTLNHFDQALEELKIVLDEVFQDSVQINTQFQKTGTWPTLGQAITENQRLFVMVRIKDMDKLTTKEKFISVVKVGENDEGKPKPDLPQGVLSILSTYGNGNVGHNCDNMVVNADRYCKSLNADWTKVASYGSSGGGSICLSSRARVCNPRISHVCDKCRVHQPIINIVFTDYPNYMASSDLSIVEVANIENLARV